MKLNMGPNKTAIMHFSNKRNQPQLNYEIPETNAYKYLGKQTQLRSNNTAHLNSYNPSKLK